MRRYAIALFKLPPLQGEGWGGDGLGATKPIPLPTSPLKGEEGWV